MSATDKHQVDFKKVSQEEKMDTHKEELPSQCSIEEVEGNKNKSFSCKQFLFGSSKRTALSVCFIVFSLIGVAGFIIGMLIISGDIKVQQHQIVTGIDGKQYNYTNLQVKPEWSLQYNDFIVMQPVLNQSRLLQEVQIQSDCLFHHSPDGLVTVQQCGNTQNVIVHDEKVDDLATDLNNDPAKVRRILAEDDSLVDLMTSSNKISQQEQFLCQIDGQNPQISNQEFVQIDSNGNLVAGVGANRRILRFRFKKIIKRVAKAVTKVVNKTINVALQVTKVAAPYIGAAIGFVVGGPTGMCAGMKIGKAVSTALQACFPDPNQYNKTPQFKCSAQTYKQNQPPGLVSAVNTKSQSVICPLKK